MRMMLVAADRPALTATDDNGDGVDDVTGEPVDPNAPTEDPAEAPAPVTLPEDRPGGTPGAAATDLPDSTGLRPFSGVLCVEGVWTGDGRLFSAGAFGWRDLPLPLMALDTTTEAHQEAVLVGRIDTITRAGAEIQFDGFWLSTPESLSFQALVDSRALRGVSVDLDDFVYDIEIPAEWLSDETPPETPTDSGGILIPGTEPRMVVSAARIMGATICPFPALQEAFITNGDDPNVAALPAVTASGGAVSGWLYDGQEAPRNTVEHAVAAADSGRVVILASGYDMRPPICPPREWMEDPQLTAATPMTITDEGRVLGHVAAWGSCHIGFQDSCVTPPTSLANYAHFHTGEIICDDDTRLPCGNISMDTGHAALSLGAGAALAHYDNTGTAVADVRCGEDEFGIWMAGALRSNITPTQVRALMASDLSGDWRQIGGNLEMVAALAVNVPGFHKVRTASIKARNSGGIVAAMVASLPVVERPAAAINPTLTRQLADRIALSIGRTPAARIAALTARVHGGRS